MVGPRGAPPGPAASGLLAAYAERMAENPLAHPVELRELRRGFDEARRGARTADDRAGSHDLATPDGWFRAFALGVADRERLAAALGALPPQVPGRARLEALLPHHADWIRARFDPRMPSEVLREVVRQMRPDPGAPPERPDGALRAGALEAYRRHPALGALAPAFFQAVAAVDYRAAAPRSPPVVAAPRSRRSAVSSGRSSGGSGGGAWRWVVLAIALSSGVRACFRQQQRSRAPDRSIEEIMRDSDRRLKRLRERLERDSWRDTTPPGPGRGVPGK